MKRLGCLVGGSLLFWGILVYPGFLLGGETAVVYSAVSLGVCLVPAALTLLWAEWAFRKAPEQYLLMALGGTGVRMFVVLGVAFFLNVSLPYFQTFGFLLWMMVFYFFVLTLEMIVMLTGRIHAGKTMNRRGQTGRPRNQWEK